jgi:hypothetical protein
MLRVCVCFRGYRPEVLHSAAQRLTLCMMELFEATAENCFLMPEPAERGLPDA